MQYIFIKRQGDDNIINFYDELLKEFKIIVDKKWVKGVNNLTSAAGLTFEKLLGKKPDSLYLPDYYGIEIKTTQRYSRQVISNILSQKKLFLGQKKCGMKQEKIKIK